MTSTIEEQQASTFITTETSRLVERIIFIMCEEYKGYMTNLSKSELKLKVINGLEKALDYGFSIDEHIIEFINLTFVWGDDFDISAKTSWAGDILSWKDTSNDAKIRGLIDKSEAELDKNIKYNKTNCK